MGPGILFRPSSSMTKSTVGWVLIICFTIIWYSINTFSFYSGLRGVWWCQWKWCAGGILETASRLPTPSSSHQPQSLQFEQQRCNLFLYLSFGCGYLIFLINRFHWRRKLLSSMGQTTPSFLKKVRNLQMDYRVINLIVLYFLFICLVVCLVLVLMFSLMFTIPC